VSTNATAPKQLRIHTTYPVNQLRQLGECARALSNTCWWQRA